MREALSILASATVLPSSATPSAPNTRRRRYSTTTTTTTTKTRPKPNPKQKPQFPAPSPLLSSSRWDNRQNLAYHSQLASKLVEDGRFVDFLMIAETVVASGVKMSDFLALMKSESVVNGILKVVYQGKLDTVGDVLFNGMRKLGLEPMEVFDEINIELLKTECWRLLKCGEVEQLLSLMEIFAGFQFTIKELVEPSEVINLCIKKRDPASAVRYARNFPHAEVLYCSIILEFGKKRDLNSAVKTFELSKQYMRSPNMHVYRSIIDACGLCGDFLRSRTIYEGLLADNIIPNIYIFNSLMNVNSHDLSYILDIYKKMQKLGMMADITSHNILLKSCCLAGKVELAQDTYKQIRELESKGVVKLDDFTYSAIIKVFADAKMWKQALEIKEDMMLSGVSPNTITWSSLISACANAGLVEKTIILFGEMLQAGAQPNTYCFNTLLHACVEVCQFDRAFRLFQCWKGRGLQKTLSDNKLSSEEKIDAVDHMSDSEMGLPLSSHLTMRVPFRPTTSTYNIMMKACGTDYHRAKDLMKEMKTFGLTPNHISWSILMDVCGGSGNVQGAIQILTSMHESGIRPDVITYTTAIKICVEHKKPNLAFTLFDEMNKNKIKPNLVTYNTILRAPRIYGSLQGVQQCLAVYQHMRKAGYKANDYYLKQLIEDWCEGVIHTESRNKDQFASHITDFGRQSLLLEKVAEYLQDGPAEGLFIDLRGLTKVEARIVVLAVLRKIKEKYAAGNSIKDDMFIILGQHKYGARITIDEGGVGEAVIRLFQHDLAIEVSETSGNDPNPNNGSSSSSGLNLEEEENSRLAETLESPTRRPIVLQRIKVTRKSLNHWLQRRQLSSKR